MLITSRTNYLISTLVSHLVSSLISDASYVQSCAISSTLACRLFTTMAFGRHGEARCDNDPGTSDSCRLDTRCSMLRHQAKSLLAADAVTLPSTIRPFLHRYSSTIVEMEWWISAPMWSDVAATTSIRRGWYGLLGGCPVDNFVTRILSCRAAGLSANGAKSNPSKWTRLHYDLV
ncbi:hypothetical protein BJ546DRAFT_131368 [Cryomyces antarcticus]